MALAHYWTPEQMERLLANIEPGPKRLYALLVWRTGLRRGEALALCWRDIFLGRDPMLIVRHAKGGLERSVPVHPELATALGMVEHGRPDEKLFKFSYQTAHRVIRDAIAKAGLEEESTGTGKRKASVHSLRHSAARHWLGSGRPVNHPSAWLGHSSPKVTLDTYLPLNPGEMSHMDGIE